MKRIYAIPGLGTTKELFRFLKIDNAEIIVLNWPEIVEGDTMETYAEKFTAQIDISKPFYLMGVSFGGMLSVELAHRLNPEKTFIISSAKFNKEIPRSLRFFRFFPLHLIVGEKTLRRMNANSRRIIGFDKSFLPEFIQMMESMQPDYYKYSIDCILKWKRKETGKTVVHLHGTADRLLPFKFVKADWPVLDGTHAMIVNNADEIGRIVTQNL